MNTTREALLQNRGLNPILQKTPARAPSAYDDPFSRVFGATNRVIGDARSRTAPSPKPANATGSPTVPASQRAAQIRADRSNAASASRYQAMADAFTPKVPVSASTPFDPNTYDWASEGGGSRPSGVDVEALRAARLGAGDTSGFDATTTQADDKPSSKPEVPDYPTEGSALSAEVFGALAERRRVVDEQLQKAMEQEKFQSERLKLAAETARTQVAREFRNLAEDLQMKLGGRGLATDPRFAGRGRRRLQMQESEKFGEISQTLADEISALQEMVQTVSDARDREMAKIAQDEALARTMPSALLPAALQYSE